MSSTPLMEQKIIQKIMITFDKIGKKNIQEGKYYTDLMDYYYRQGSNVKKIKRNITENIQFYSKM